MTRPDPDTMKAIVTMARNQPLILEWLDAWYVRELERLPSITSRVEVAQGRCQVLKELRDLVTNALNPGA